MSNFFGSNLLGNTDLLKKLSVLLLTSGLTAAGSECADVSNYTKYPECKPTGHTSLHTIELVVGIAVAALLLAYYCSDKGRKNLEAMTPDCCKSDSASYRRVQA